MTEIELRERLAKNLIYYRKRAGLTQAALAERIAYTDKSVSKWERGEGVPDSYVLSQLCRQLNVSADRLLFGEPPKRLPPTRRMQLLIGLISVGLVFLIATVTFFVLGLCLPESEVLYLCFIVAIPVSAVVAIVFSCLWWGPIAQGLSVTALIWSLAACINIAFTAPNLEYAYLIAGVMQILTILWFILIGNRKNRNL
ncbi:MAG: helix-turn-helix transcriptional regulator [Clostridia bacterium]|nr:helix-turn-helix transcriptional regulator [Clostridia bacterium]